MKIAKAIFAMTMVFAAMFVLAGDSTSFVLDNVTSPSGESVVLPWNAEWIGGNANATAVITDNGTEVKRATGIGEFTLNISCGNHLIEYSTFISGVKQGETYTAQVELAHIEIETKAAKGATCTQAGWTHEVSCRRCHAVLEASLPILALGHAEVETKNAKAASCTEDGWTHEVACSRCHAVLVTSSSIPAFGHDEVVTKPPIDPTVNRAGKTAEITCGRCGAVLQEQRIIPVIFNMMAKQRYPWNGKVDVSFEVDGDMLDGVTEVNDVVISLSALNREDGMVYTAGKSALSGDVGACEGMHHIVWDLNAQGLELKSDAVVFTAAYEKKPRLYCVIDLSSGKDAAAYPVTYLTEVPSGGWTDEYKTTKLVLRLIQPGTFLMNDGYLTTLTKPFYCGVFEVTQQQYELVTGLKPSYYAGDTRPVESVSWNVIRGDSSTYNWPSSASVDASSFVGRLQSRTGLNFDLPTEAQWEYACRAGTTGKFNNGGDTENDLMQLGRYSRNQSDSRGGYASNHTTVGSYQANAWGLYDMHGNVWEWCLDWYGSRTDGATDPVGAASGSYRVRRGGSWSNGPDYCTSSYLNYQTPSNENIQYGFRIARTLPNVHGSSSAPTITPSTFCMGEAASVAIDSRMGVENRRVDNVPWDASWIGGDPGATVVICDNGIEVRRATGIGAIALSAGRHDLEYGTYVNAIPQAETYLVTVYKCECNPSLGDVPLVETKTAKEASCLEAGWTHEVKCGRCNMVVEPSLPLPAGHLRRTTVTAIEPTCTADGRTATVVCSRCGETLEKSEVVPGGHTGAITKPAIEPTSSTAGKTAEITCSRCGEVLQEQTTIPALGYIRNVRAAQLWPHKKVEICYEIATDIGEVATSATLPTITCRYGSTTKTASTVWGDPSLSPGRHVVVWDFEADGIVLDRSDVTFAISYGTDSVLTVNGLSVKYYDISSSGYSTWTQSETAMLNYFASRTPTLEASTIDWGAGLSAGLSEVASKDRSNMSNAGITDFDNELTCRYHGKYSSKGTDYFASYISGHLCIENPGNYAFAIMADDYVVLYVDGIRICNAQWDTVASGSLTLAAGWHTINMAFYEVSGGQGFIMRWKKPGDSSYSLIPLTSLSDSTTTSSNAGGGLASGSVSAIAVNTSASVKDGMSVAGTVNLGYSPFADGEGEIRIDGALAISSTNSGVFAWQPRTTGTHTLKHVSGDYEWTRIVNVTSLAYDTPPAPNPPTAADANISIGSTSRAFAVGGGSGTITTSGSGTWSASASDDWITIPSAMASRNAGLPVVYQVNANSGVEERTGYIYVSGHVFTITQVGVGGELDAYSADFETDGGTDSFTVLADAQTSWKARSNVDWISVAVEGTGNGEWGTAGVGEQRVIYNVAPWNEVSTRSGTITAAGCTFTVNQTGRRMKLVVADGGAAGAERQPYQVERDYLSHVIDVQVNALASTDWDIELDGSWISIVDAGTGHGAGSVALAINENPSWLARSGMVRIGSEWLTINQAGRPSNALDFSISPENTTASVKGANALISVMATPDLPWTATSQANWLTIMPSFQDGAGNGNVVYTASPNPTMANRSGIIQIAATKSAALAAKTHRVTQPAATSMVSDDACVFDAAGESHPVEVTVDDIVNWTVSENISWLSVVESTSRIGPGSVTLVASENLTVNPREANLTIAGHPFHVVQKGRTVEVEYTSRVFGTASDYASIDVHPDGNVQWTAVSSDPSWLTIWGDDGCEYDDYGNVIATGDHTIEYIVSDYVGDGTPRTATITIGDKTVYITQRPYDLSINPSAATVGGNAGAGTVGVPATAGQVWNAIATEPWITVQSGYDAGTGSGTVRYTYTDNDTGEERTGRIIIAGEEYTIIQAARQMVAVNVTTRVVTASGEQGTGNGGVVSGAGTYDRGTSVTLTATANDGYEFLNWTLPNGSTAGGVQLVVTADVNKEIFANFRRIPVYAVNGEPVREGTSKTFTAPADVIDAAGTTKLVCLGTSRYPEKGTSFTLVVTEDIDFEWDLWQTNYLVTVSQSSGGAIKNGSSLAPTTSWVSAGSTIDLTAIPDSGKSFFRWNLSNPDNPVNPVENDSAPSASLRLCVSSPLTVSAVFGTFNDTLATALDAPALTFTTGGDASWLPVIDATAQTGYTSARSGAIGAEAETWLDTTVEGAGTLSVRWRVDCEKDDGGGATWDRLAVFTNGVEVARIDGKTDWQTVTIEIPNSPTPNSPTQTLIRWSFYRDDFDEPGQEHENAAWVDGIIFTKEGE